MKKDKYIDKYLIVTFILFLILGVSMRLAHDNSYNTSEGEYVPSNADGNHWINQDVTHSEKWATYNPLNNKYFSFITFLIVIVFGLLFLNYNSINMKVSALFTFFMLFSKYLYVRSSIGFYDHDFLGMCIFMVLIGIYFIGGSLLYLAPVLIYSLNIFWDGLIPVAYILSVVLFIEYIVRNRGYMFHTMKYALYILMVWYIIKDTYNPFYLIAETQFYPLLLIIIAPFLLIGIYLSFKQKEWFWRGILLFSTIILFHSNRMVIVAYPLIFLSVCYLLRKDTYKYITYTLIILFVITQVGIYTQLDRYGTEDTDKGMYYLKYNTTEDSKILSWWDHGYYIEHISDKKALFKGSAKAKGLDELSWFYCDGTMPSFTFDYFVHFVYRYDLIEPILNYKGNKCDTLPYIYSLVEYQQDDRFIEVFSNKDIIIFKKTG